MAEAFKKIAKAEVEISRTKFLLKCLWSELGANSNNLNRYLQKAEEGTAVFSDQSCRSHWSILSTQGLDSPTRRLERGRKKGTLPVSALRKLEAGDMPVGKDC